MASVNIFLRCAALAALQGGAAERVVTEAAVRAKMSPDASNHQAAEVCDFSEIHSQKKTTFYCYRRVYKTI